MLAFAEHYPGHSEYAATERTSFAGRELVALSECLHSFFNDGRDPHQCVHERLFEFQVPFVSGEVPLSVRFIQYASLFTLRFATGANEALDLVMSRRLFLELPGPDQLVEFLTRYAHLQ